MNKINPRLPVNELRVGLMASCLMLGACNDALLSSEINLLQPGEHMNLSSTADVSTLHPALFNSRFAYKAIDGMTGDKGDNCWVPSVDGINSDKPVLLALSWDTPVLIDSITIEGFRNWPLTDLTLATWKAKDPLRLEAPTPNVDKYSDVFISGTGGYHTYRIPAMVVSSQGTLLAFAEARKNSAGDRGAIDIVLKRSFDDGKTWEEQQLVYGEEGDVTIGNPVPIVDRITGDIHLIFAREMQRIFYVKSTDDGQTFSEPIDITASVETMCDSIGFSCPHILPGPGHGLQTSTGRLVVPVKPANSDPGYFTRRVGVIYSDDHGLTWKPGGAVPNTLGELSESTLFETGDGSLVLNMRWHEDLYRAVSTSNDGGLTWSDPQPQSDLPDPNSQGSVLRYSNQDSDQRVLFSNLNHQEEGTAYRNRLTVKLSNDDGAAWPVSKEIVPGPSGYSDLGVTKDQGKVIVLFERGTEIYSEKITAGRFDIAGLTGSDTGRYEIDGVRYDIAQARYYRTHPHWKELFSLHDNGQRVVTHAFEKPVQTHTLLLLIDGVTQPDDYAYVQEIYVWGKELTKP